MKRFFGILFLLVVIGGGFWVFRTLNPPRVGGVPFAQLPPTEQKKRREDAENVIKRVETLARDVKMGQKKPFELDITQDELNTLVQDRIKTKNLPISDLSIGLQSGTLVMQGKADYQGLSAPVTLQGNIKAQNGDVVFSVDSLSIAGLPAPGDWKEKVQKAVESGLNKALEAKGSAKIESVEIGDGNLKIKGQTG